MLKKVAIFWVVLLLLGFNNLIWPDKPQAETYVYGGSQIIVPGGETDKIGAGSMVAFGQRLGDHLIGWVNIENFKTGEGKDKTNGYTGLSLLSGELIKRLNAGAFLTLEAGVEDSPNTPAKFGHLINAGFYSKATSTTTFWLGGGVSGKVWSIDIGTSIKFWE